MCDGDGDAMRLEKGHLLARLAAGGDDLARAQVLRHACFHAGSDRSGSARPGSARPGRDEDSFDATTRHLLIEDREERLLACFRYALLPANAVATGYSAQFYDLTPLARQPWTYLEIGRFCIRQGVADPDVLRLAWAAITRLVDDNGVAMMFGCTSFPGADPARHASALAFLRGHLGPTALRPGQKGQGVAFPERAAAEGAGPAAPLPPLLRSYLGLGGWVSDHAVRDPGLDTLHVFTAVELALIPPARARALRALAA